MLLPVGEKTLMCFSVNNFVFNNLCFFIFFDYFQLVIFNYYLY